MMVSVDVKKINYGELRACHLWNRKGQASLSICSSSHLSSQNKVDISFFSLISTAKGKPFDIEVCLYKRTIFCSVKYGITILGYEANRN